MHSRNCEIFTASMVEAVQYSEYGNRLHEISLEQPLEHYIVNNMYDETMLYVSVGGRKGKRRRTIAHASQMTFTHADA